MGVVASCLRPQPRYTRLAPPVERRKVKREEIQRPHTKRLEMIQERAKNLDTVATAEVTNMPSLLSPTESAAEWVQLEGTFSQDVPARPLSQKLVDKFKKQDEECKTWEREIARKSQKSLMEKLAAEALAQSDESDDEETTAERADRDVGRPNDNTDTPHETENGRGKQALFEETLSTEGGEEAPHRNESSKRISFRGAKAKFDGLDHKSTIVAKENHKRTKESTEKNEPESRTQSVTFAISESLDQKIAETNLTKAEQVGNKDSRVSKKPSRRESRKSSPRTIHEVASS